MATRTYNPLNIIGTFKGHHIRGYGPDTFVIAERQEDAFSDIVGCDGEVTRVQSNDKRGTVTWTLMPESDSNDALSAFAVLDEESGAGKGELILKDTNGTTLFHSSDAWIVKFPRFERGKEPGPCEWVIRCAKLETFIGGSLS